MEDLVNTLARALYLTLAANGSEEPVPDWGDLPAQVVGAWRYRAELLTNMKFPQLDKWLGIGAAGVPEPEGPQPGPDRTRHAPDQTEGAARDRAHLYLVETETWKIRPSSLEEDGVEGEGARLTTIENVSEDESLRGLDPGDLRELARALHCYRLLRGM